MFMGFAFLGGMILNLMPCVFQVLSIKAMSFTKNVGETSQKQRMDGVFYTLGVVVAFVTLASVLIALRRRGSSGLGIPVSAAWFLAFIVYLFFLMGLGTGVFEIGASLMGAGGSLTAGWLSGIVLNRCAGHHRRNAVHGTLHGADRFCADAVLAGGHGCICLTRSRYGFSDSVAELLTRAVSIFTQTRTVDGDLQAVHGLPAVCLCAIFSLGAW